MSLRKLSGALPLYGSLFCNTLPGKLPSLHPPQTLISASSNLWDCCSCSLCHSQGRPPVWKLEFIEITLLSGITVLHCLFLKTVVLYIPSSFSPEGKSSISHSIMARSTRLQSDIFNAQVRSCHSSAQNCSVAPHFITEAKILTMAFKILHVPAPRYLSFLISSAPFNPGILSFLLFREPLCMLLP